MESKSSIATDPAALKTQTITPRHDPGRQFIRQKTAAKKNLGKRILAMRSGKLRSHQMKIAVNSPDFAKSWRAAEHSSFQNISFQRFSFTQTPLFPRNPHEIFSGGA